MYYYVFLYAHAAVLCWPSSWPGKRRFRTWLVTAVACSMHWRYSSGKLQCTVSVSFIINVYSLSIYNIIVIYHIWGSMVQGMQYLFNCCSAVLCTWSCHFFVANYAIHGYICCSIQMKMHNGEMEEQRPKVREKYPTLYHLHIGILNCGLLCFCLWLCVVLISWLCDVAVYY